MDVPLDVVEGSPVKTYKARKTIPCSNRKQLETIHSFFRLSAQWPSAVNQEDNVMGQVESPSASSLPASTSVTENTNSLDSSGYATKTKHAEEFLKEASEDDRKYTLRLNSVPPTDSETDLNEGYDKGYTAVPYPLESVKGFDGRANAHTTEQGLVCGLDNRPLLNPDSAFLQSWCSSLSTSSPSLSPSHTLESDQDLGADFLVLSEEDILIDEEGDVREQESCGGTEDKHGQSRGNKNTPFEANKANDERGAAEFEEAKQEEYTENKTEGRAQSLMSKASEFGGMVELQAAHNVDPFGCPPASSTKAMSDKTTLSSSTLYAKSNLEGEDLEVSFTCQNSERIVEEHSYRSRSTNEKHASSKKTLHEPVRTFRKATREEEGSVLSEMELRFKRPRLEALGPNERACLPYGQAMPATIHSGVKKATAVNARSGVRDLKIKTGLIEKLRTEVEKRNVMKKRKSPLDDESGRKEHNCPSSSSLIKLTISPEDRLDLETIKKKPSAEVEKNRTEQISALHKVVQKLVGVELKTQLAVFDCDLQELRDKLHAINCERFKSTLNILQGKIATLLQTVLNAPFPRDTCTGVKKLSEPLVNGSHLRRSSTTAAATPVLTADVPVPTNSYPAVSKPTPATCTLVPNVSAATTYTPTLAISGPAQVEVISGLANTVKSGFASAAIATYPASSSSSSSSRKPQNRAFLPTGLSIQCIEPRPGREVYSAERPWSTGTQAPPATASGSVMMPAALSETSDTAKQPDSTTPETVAQASGLVVDLTEEENMAVQFVAGMQNVSKTQSTDKSVSDVLQTIVISTGSPATTSKGIRFGTHTGEPTLTKTGTDAVLGPPKQTKPHDLQSLTAKSPVTTQETPSSSTSAETPTTPSQTQRAVGSTSSPPSLCPYALPPTPKSLLTAGVTQTSPPQQLLLKLVRVPVHDGLVLSWSVDRPNERCASPDLYQLYACHHDSSVSGAAGPWAGWKKIGEMEAMPLPMACVLSHFVAGTRYYYAVRSRDVYGRYGPFSEPRCSDDAV